MLILNIIILFIFLLINLSNSFVAKKYINVHISHNTKTTLFDAATSLIKKGKIREVESLKKEFLDNKENLIDNFLAKGKYRDDYGEPIPFIESVYNRFKSVTIMPEYSKKAKTVI